MYLIGIIIENRIYKVVFEQGHGRHSEFIQKYQRITSIADFVIDVENNVVLKSTYRNYEDKIGDEPTLLNMFKYQQIITFKSLLEEEPDLLPIT